ncbi:MAG TPA: DUF4399 domain-containing protein [Gemmatimonadales bacterium]|nr:DUF4399 domain-containing protein [Gemmatimonadales bacterium]
MKRYFWLAKPLLAALVAACSSDSGPRVQILEPAPGAVVEGPVVRVRLSASGITIAPAAEQRPGTAHHHLFLDTDATAPGAAIPQGFPGIVHLGAGQSEFVFDSLPPGEHRLIALLADPAHLVHSTPVADTVRFTVR